MQCSGHNNLKNDFSGLPFSGSWGGAHMRAIPTLLTPQRRIRGVSGADRCKREPILDDNSRKSARGRTPRPTKHTSNIPLAPEKYRIRSRPILPVYTSAAKVSYPPYNIPIRGRGGQKYVLGKPGAGGLTRACRDPSAPPVRQSGGATGARGSRGFGGRGAGVPPRAGLLLVARPARGPQCAE